MACVSVSARVASWMFSIVFMVLLFLFSLCVHCIFFFFSSRRRHTRFDCDWSSDVCSSDLFGNPVHCIRIDKDGLVYVCDRTNNRLQMFRKDGTFVAEHVYEKATRGTGSVYDLVFSPDRDQKFIYMIDGMNGEVRIVDRASKETLGRFGRPGRQIGQFTALHNIAVDRQGNIFTSEVNTGQRVQKFRRIDMQN